MSFKRVHKPTFFARGDALTKDLNGIGFVLMGQGTADPNIEDTLIAASIEGIKGDFRTLSLLAQWIGIHLPYVNADRLITLVQTLDPATQKFWCAIAQWKRNDKRFARLLKLKPKQRMELGPGAKFQIERHGEDSRFRGTCLKVAANLLRVRERDILSPKELAQKHTAYRFRVMMGPSYRADMWAALESNPHLSPSELARRTYGSFATAWNVIEDRKVAA